MAEEKKKIVDVVEVIRHKDKKIILPEIPLDRIIEVLKRQAQYEEERTDIIETIPVFPFDGAIALHQAMEEQFGVAFQEGTFFSDAQTLKVEVGPDETRSVPWGTFSLPNLEDGHVCTNTVEVDGRIGIRIHIKVKRKYEAQANLLLSRTRELAKLNSIHRGKAFSIEFEDGEDINKGDHGDGPDMPLIKFLRLASTVPIFRRELEADIERDILTAIRYTAKFREDGIPLKLGVLAAGVYGTGKTLLANHVANVAVANGWTFIYAPNTGELSEVLQFAQAYQPCVVFAEDAERAAGLERTDEVNDLLNIMDGVGSKNVEMIVVLTSNHPEKLNAAMRRPGRIDVMLNVLPPDAEAVGRLIRLYAAEALAAGEDLAEVGRVLDGEIPAVVREVVEQSKRAALNRTRGQDTRLIAADLLVTAKRYKANREAFAPVSTTDVHAQTVQRLGNAIGEPIGRAITMMASKGNGKSVEDAHPA